MLMMSIRMEIFHMRTRVNPMLATVTRPSVNSKTLANMNK